MKFKVLIIILLCCVTSFAFSQSNLDKMRIFIADKNYDEAVKLIDAVIKDSPKDWRNIVTCGDVYFELEKYIDAMHLYEKAYDIEYKKVEVIKKLGTTYSILGKHKEALEILNKAVKDNDNDIDLLMVLANAYTKCDSSNKAELLINRAKSMDKKNPLPLIALGDMYFAQRVYELAKNNYEDALSINKNLIDARIKLATSYYWLANRESDTLLSNELFGRSLKEWLTVSTQDPKNSKAYFEQGKILFFSRKFDDAAKSLYRYIQLRPSGSLGRWYLAQCLNELNMCDSAAEHLDIVSREIDSVKTKAKLLLARCYYFRNNFKRSVEVFTELKSTEKLESIDMLRYG